VALIFLGAPSAASPEIEERPTFAALLGGERTHWLSKPQPFDVWDAKGLARALVLRLLQREPSVTIAAAHERPPALHPRGAASVGVAGRRAGWIGPLHPDVADAFEIQGAAVVVELD